MKHTELPFSIWHNGDGEIDIEGPDGCSICTMEGGDNAEAFATFIVRACNCHYDLLKALKAVEADCMDRGDSLLWTKLGSMIRAAIAKAEAE